LKNDFSNKIIISNFYFKSYKFNFEFLKTKYTKSNEKLLEKCYLSFFFLCYLNLIIGSWLLILPKEHFGPEFGCFGEHFDILIKLLNLWVIIIWLFCMFLWEVYEFNINNKIYFWILWSYFVRLTERME
jgi:hypothetical protein